MRRLFLILLFSITALAQQNDPVADPAAIITAGNPRFTILPCAPPWKSSIAPG
jgi:hypothetical protein